MLNDTYTLDGGFGYAITGDYLHYLDNDVIIGGGFAYSSTSTDVINRFYFSYSDPTQRNDGGGSRSRTVTTSQNGLDTNVFEAYMNIGGVLVEGVDLVLQIKLQSNDLESSEESEDRFGDTVITTTEFTDGFPSSSVSFALFLNFTLDNEDAIRLYYDFGASDTDIDCRNSELIFCDGPSGGFGLTYNFVFN